MTETALCELCGEPMPAGEEMFKFHGYSGPCPKPPLARPAMSEAKHTPGPWAWFGNANGNHVYLATVHGGRRYVMDFVRWGMHGAQPRFQPERGGMVDAKDLLQFEVGDQAIVGIDAARKDRGVYRYDVRGINSADACLIAAAPDLLEVLKKLAAEMVGVSGFGPEIRELVGNTNWDVLTQRVQEAHAAIAKAEGRS